MESGRGRAEGRSPAALFVSDFHLGDGTAGGDDFLESHLRPEERFGGLYNGFFPPGESRASLFASVVTFALDRPALSDPPVTEVSARANHSARSRGQRQPQPGHPAGRHQVPPTRAAAASRTRSCPR